jgi:tellurite resistance protein TerC
MPSLPSILAALISSSIWNWYYDDSETEMQRIILMHLVIRTMAHAKRLIVITIGFTVLLAGIAMVVLPGPAVIVIPVGLTILATEFIWARKLLNSLKERIQRMKNMKRTSGYRR